MKRMIAASLLGLLCANAWTADRNKIVEVEDSFQSVVVRPGETLWSISHTYLKDPARWDELLKHNRLPTSDPTVALPGMTLRVPIQLIKTSLRAAHLVYLVNRVLHRRKDRPDWKDSKTAMELFQGDFLRTLEDSKARVKFLNKELLSLEPNSMAVIKPTGENADVVLRAGSVFAGHARVITAGARITPRTSDTRYSASVEADLTTKVEVYTGRAAVDAQGSQVEVPAGMETRVVPGLAPEVPRLLQNPAELEARGIEFVSAQSVGGAAAPSPRAAPEAPEPEADASVLRGDIESQRVGAPILGFHVQAANDREFQKIVFDRKYDSDQRFSPTDANLPAGAYWWKIAIIDLLGTEGRYSTPRYYSVGVQRKESALSGSLNRLLTITSPAEGALVGGDSVTVNGVLRDDRLRVEVSGKPVRIDADGNWTTTATISEGSTEIIIVVSDGKGNQSRISRRVTRR